MTTHSQYTDYWGLDEIFPTLGQKTKIYVLFAMGHLILKEWWWQVKLINQKFIIYSLHMHRPRLFTSIYEKLGDWHFQGLLSRSSGVLWLFPNSSFFAVTLGMAAVLLPEEQKKEGGNKMSKMYSGGGTIAAPDCQGLGFFNYEINQNLRLLFEAITEEPEHKAAGQHPAFVQICFHPVLPSACCLTGSFQSSARATFVPHLCYHRSVSNKISEIFVLSAQLASPFVLLQAAILSVSLAISEKLFQYISK